MHWRTAAEYRLDLELLGENSKVIINFYNYQQKMKYENLEKKKKHRRMLVFAVLRMVDLKSFDLAKYFMEKGFRIEHLRRPGSVRCCDEVLWKLYIWHLKTRKRIYMRSKHFSAWHSGQVQQTFLQRRLFSAEGSYLLTLYAFRFKRCWILKKN